MTNVATDIENFWDIAYRQGDHVEHWESPHAPQELAAIIATGAVPPGGTVLDVGCGAGREAIFLAQCGFQAIGVDLSREALKIALQRCEGAGIEVDWRLGDVLDLPVDDASVDFITDRGCFHVIDRDCRPQFVRELNRVLRPCGSILIRGAARDDEEGGLVAVDAEEIDEYFIAERFEHGPVVPIAMEAPAGALHGKLAFLQKCVRG